MGASPPLAGWMCDPPVGIAGLQGYRRFAAEKALQQAAAKDAALGADFEELFRPPVIQLIICKVLKI
jgi:hypothetical protein